MIEALKKLSKRHFSHVVMYRDFDYVEFDASWKKKHLQVTDVDFTDWASTKNIDEACRFTLDAACLRARRMSLSNNSRGRYIVIYARDAEVYSVMSR